MKFRDLSIGDTFDDISPNRGYNSFYDTCKKTGTRTYVSLDSGQKYRVGSINAAVYHVNEYKTKQRLSGASKLNVLPIAGKIVQILGRKLGGGWATLKHVGQWRYGEDNDTALIDIGYLYVLISVTREGETIYKARLPVKNWGSEIDGDPGEIPLYGAINQTYKGQGEKTINAIVGDIVSDYWTMARLADQELGPEDE